MRQQIEQARAAGYSDQEILQYLTQEGLVPAEKVQQAIGAQYQPHEILEHLGAPVAPTMGETAKRVAGSAARDIVKGAAALPITLPGDALNSAINLGITGVNRLTGAKVPRLLMPSQVIDQGLDAAGLGKPQGRLEEGVSTVTQALSGAGAVGAASKLASKAPGAISQLLDFFAKRPGAQIGAGAGSAVAVDQAKNTAGVADPRALAAIGMAGAMIAPTAAQAGAPAVRGATSIVRPFTEPGRRAIAGQTLKTLTANPDAAVARIDNGYPTYVPGSRPMTHEVAGDPGLIGAAGPLFARLDTRNLRGQRLSENNAARMTVLDRMAKDETAITHAKAKRDEITAPMRQDAFGKVDVDPATFQSGMALAIDNHIQTVLTSPAGKRQDVERALRWARGRIARANTPDELYEVRKDLRAAAHGRYNDDIPSLRLAKRELEDVIGVVDDVIDSAAPGYRAYLKQYHKMSIPIDQMRTLQGLRESGTVAPQDPLTSGNIFSQAKMKKQVAAILADRDVRLSTTQQAAIKRILADLNRAQAASTSAVARAPGSDTFKNFSMASLIGRVVGEAAYGTSHASLPQQMAKPLSWLYSLPDEKVGDLMVEAMLDPKLYRDLVRAASIVKIEPFSEALKRKALEAGIIAPAVTGGTQ